MSKSQVSVTPQKAAENWAVGLVQKIPKITDGISRVTVHPGQQAAAQQQKLINNWNASVTSGKWAKNVAAGTLGEWKTKTIEKTTQRMAGGVEGAKPKYINKMTGVFNHMNSVLPTIAAMPDFTIEDSINRVAAMMRHMHNYVPS